MKIRNGFVSNSSSSSFIIAFDEKPDSIEKIQKHLPSTISISNYGYDLYEVAKRIFYLINDSSQQGINSIYDKMQYGYVFGEPEYDWNRDRNDSNYEKEFERKRNDFYLQKAKDFVESNKDKYIVCFSVEDYNDLDAFIESGSCFIKVPHIKISQH
jgi:hypothetical protein